MTRCDLYGTGEPWRSCCICDSRVDAVAGSKMLPLLGDGVRQNRPHRLMTPTVAPDGCAVPGDVGLYQQGGWRDDLAVHFPETYPA
jgi:hypothetical protein